MSRFLDLRTSGLAIAIALTSLAAPAVPASAQATQAPPAPAPAQSEHPALRLPRPPASEIIANFIATCVEHAGDPAAQTAAGERRGITWPFRLTVGRNNSDQCALVSTVADGETTRTLGAALEAALRARGPASITYVESSRVGVRLDGEFTAGTRQFEFTGNVGSQPGAPLATSVLILFNSRSPR